jgi:hypothetical protein
VAAIVRAELTASRITDLAAVEHEEISRLADGELGGLLRARQQVVTDLLAEIVDRVRRIAPRTNVRVIDGSGAQLGYATGRPDTSAPATSIAWRQGLDLTIVPSLCDLVVCGYFADPRRLERELASYEEVIGAEAYERLELIIRPALPDVATREDLVERVRVASAGGVRELGFYHYGLVRLEALDWISAALSARVRARRG